MIKFGGVSGFATGVSSRKWNIRSIGDSSATDFAGGKGMVDVEPC